METVFAGITIKDISSMLKFWLQAIMGITNIALQVVHEQIASEILQHVSGALNLVPESSRKNNLKKETDFHDGSQLGT